MGISSTTIRRSGLPFTQGSAGQPNAPTMAKPGTEPVERQSQAGLKPLILIVDDDAAMVKLVAHNLDAAGYRVLMARDGEQAIRMIRQDKPHLVLLDVLLPGMDGFQVCQSIREFSDIPVMMITAKGETQNVVRGLDMGADDYMSKPFDIDVLIARVRAVLSRTRFSEKPERPPMMLGELRIDLSNRAVAMAGRDIALTHTEYRVLCLLARNAGRMITKDYILTEVWGPEYRGDDHVLQVTVARLRRKIGDYQRNPRYIVTKMGVGYMFRKLEDQAGIAAAISPGGTTRESPAQPCAGRERLLQSVTP
ncbi:MAG: response regulator transcription factor [Chloroflexi bacterium]|nr:response regulator transcription factor [Chloroflexota bacterium]